jgi:transcriptional regulator with XRE-family HTH domain
MTSFKRLRKKANINQAKLADMLGVAQATVSYWEAGQSFPTVEKLKKLTEIFRCTSDELIGLSPPDIPIIAKTEEENHDG